ncbi:unnamed protein product [Pleuronectes platessa]|uniref:Uncharacterized protein n=1 Tax=Pleuronectes platessa TaxID=8262 RepID=A0A9N7Z124_PLEPL|nr:unnamed protein product [Pleuronectes platessa]
MRQQAVNITQLVLAEQPQGWAANRAPPGQMREDRPVFLTVNPTRDKPIRFHLLHCVLEPHGPVTHAAGGSSTGAGVSVISRAAAAERTAGQVVRRKELPSRGEGEGRGSQFSLSVDDLLWET